MTKQEIRKSILRKRKTLPEWWVIKQSRKIHRRLAATGKFRRARTIMFYISKGNEVETRSMIEHARRKKKTVCAPCTDKAGHRLYPAIIESPEKDLVEGNYGIPEPRNRAARPKRIDLVITPGIAFDVNGYRLGWGKAYYDRFLEGMGNIPKIGLAFEFQIVPCLPVDSHDIPMDEVITERRIITKKSAATALRRAGAAISHRREI